MSFSAPSWGVRSGRKALVLLTDLMCGTCTPDFLDLTSRGVDMRLPCRGSLSFLWLCRRSGTLLIDATDQRAVSRLAGAGREMLSYDPYDDDLRCFEPPLLVDSGSLRDSTPLLSKPEKCIAPSAGDNFGISSSAPITLKMGERPPSEPGVKVTFNVEGAIAGPVKDSRDACLE